MTLPVVSTPIAVQQATPPAGAPEGGEGGPPPAGGGVPPNQELPGQTFRASEFGLHKIGNVELSSDLRTRYDQLLQLTADHLTQYRDSTKPPRRLTKMQQDFLSLYTPNKEHFLGTATGWSLAHLVIEEEMFLRLAKLEKDIILEIQRIGIKPGTPPERIVTMKGQVIKGLPQQVKDAVKEFGLSLDDLITSITTGKKLEVASVLQGHKIDISSLPKKYQDYIDYIDPKGINPEGAAGFLLQVDKARKDFYSALGLKPDNLKAATPWERFRATPAIAGGAAAVAADISRARENIGTVWMRYRDEQLKKLIDKAKGPKGADLELTDPTHVAFIFFKAQEATVAKFTEDRLKEIRETRPSDIPGSIAQMERTRDRLKSPAHLEETRAAKRSELETKTGELTQKQQELQTTITSKSNVLTERARYASRTTFLSGRLDQLSNPTTGALVKKQQEIKKAKGERSKSVTAFDKAYKAVPTGPKQAELQANIEREKTEAMREFDETLRLLREEETEIKTKITAIEDEQQRDVDNAAEETRLTGLKTTLDGDIDTLKTEIEGLEDEIKKGLSPAEQKKIEQLEAAIQALRRQPTVRTELADSAVRGESVDYLCERVMSDPAEGFGTAYRRGYLRTLELLFDYARPQAIDIKAKDFFKAAAGILPPDRLATLLARHFRLTIPAGTADNLDYVYNQLKTKVRPFPVEFNEVFFSILQDIESSGLRIG